MSPRSPLPSLVFLRPQGAQTRRQFRSHLLSRASLRAQHIASAVPAPAMDTAVIARFMRASALHLASHGGPFDPLGPGLLALPARVNRWPGGRVGTARKPH